MNENGISRQFLYDGDALVAEYANSGNTPLVRYVHGDQTDEPWVQYNGASIGQSQRIYLHTDHQHSVIVHSDGQGNVVNTLSYDNYGIPGIENVGRFGYTGQVWLGDIGLYYYKARMYSPALGRFLQTDPVGYEDQMNLYAYVGNDPLNSTDPSGMCQKDSDGNPVGVCATENSEGNTKEAANLVKASLADPDSQMASVERELASSGKMILVQTDSVDISGADVDGGKTETLGTNGEYVVVTIDKTDKTEVFGVDSQGKQTTRIITEQEILEHEVVGHGMDSISGRPAGEGPAIDAGNELRRKKGIKFKRIGHKGIIYPNPNGKN